MKDNNSLVDNISYNQKKREAERTIKKINKIYEEYLNEYKEKRSSFYFVRKTDYLRKKIKELIANGIEEDEALKKILPEAYALVKLACQIELNKTYYDVQLMAGILLNDGYVSEMATGEGKTITAALPVYLNALLGKGAHVVTPNVYLASRDYEEMKPLYETLGLTCGLVEEVGQYDKLVRIQDRASKIYQEVLRTRSYTESEKKILKKKALDKAIATFDENMIKDKRHEYKCDITYGSAHAFAFDYLYDLLEDNPKRIRNRLGNPNFVVVDEADLVLFDDATTSYNISGTQKDSLFATECSEKRDRQRYINLANNALYYLTSNPSLLREYDDPFTYQENINERYEDFTRKTPAINHCKKTKEFNLTYIGNTLLCVFFHYNDINRILNSNIDQVLRLSYQGQKLFEEGKNYHSSTHRFDLDPYTLAILIRSNKIPALSELFDNFMLSEYQDAYMDISNTIYAWIFLNKDIDYKYTNPEDSKYPGIEKKISILQNGRVASGRVYSNGLQQAVEAKEKLLIRQRRDNTIIRDTEMNDVLASIPVDAFFGRYDKIACMTGTSAKEAFRDLYHMDTFRVPRNKPKRVVDYGDRLYRTTEEKYRGILEELVKSHKKGQPVLLTTTSVEESEKLYRYLMRHLKDYGIYTDIPVLNANIETLRREARIIAKAGKKGAITIATDMAGRGTDIKLGGERGSKQEHDEITKLGGLRILGSGHYRYNRSDRQVKGRTGRQGDIGEILFFNDPEDLIKIGMSPKVVENFKGMIKGKYLEEKGNGLSPLQKAIRECQDKVEGITKESITQSQRVEGPVAVCRNQLHNMVETIKNDNDYPGAVKDMIEVVLTDIYKASAPKESNSLELKKNAKISRDNLNIELFQNLAQEFLGLKIKEEVFDSFKTREELLSFLQKCAEKRLSNKQVDKKLVDSYFRRIWLYFEDYTKSIKSQFILASMIPGSQPVSKIDPFLFEAFRYSFHSMYAETVRDILHPIRDKKNDHFGVFDLQIKSDGRVEFLSHADTSEMSDEDRKFVFVYK